jgi:hypothetical protein
VHVTPANNSVHLAGICAEGFNVVVKKKKPDDLPNLGKHQKQAQLHSVGKKPLRKSTQYLRDFN